MNDDTAQQYVRCCLSCNIFERWGGGGGCGVRKAIETLYLTTKANADEK